MVLGTSVTDARHLSMVASPCAFSVKNMFASNVPKKKRCMVKGKKGLFAINVMAQTLISISACHKKLKKYSL